MSLNILGVMLVYGTAVVDQAVHVAVCFFGKVMLLEEYEAQKVTPGVAAACRCPSAATQESYRAFLPSANIPVRRLSTT